MLILLLRHSPCFQACTEPQRSPFNTPDSCKKTTTLALDKWEVLRWRRRKSIPGRASTVSKGWETCTVSWALPKGHIARRWRLGKGKRPEWSAAQVKQGFVGHRQEFVLSTSNTKCYRCHHFFRYMRINVEQLWCAPETHIISYVGYSFY